MDLPITSLFAALLTALFIYLCAQVILYRRANRLSIGDEGDRNLLRLMRAQGNFAEYTPLALLLLALAELQGAPSGLVGVLGLMLLAGRLLHAIAFVIKGTPMSFRVYGMVLTFLMLIGSACTALLFGLL